MNGPGKNMIGLLGRISGSSGEYLKNKQTTQNNSGL